MTGNDLLEYILERLGGSKAGEEVFGVDETENWPSGALSSLIQHGFLRPAEPARSAICDGCEERCPMPVESLIFPDSRPLRFFIFCDKPISLGHIWVNPTRLKQWKISNGLLAKKLSVMFGFDKTPKMENHGKSWALGILKGKKKKAQAILTFENSVHLQMAGHEILLHEVLRFHQGIPKMDSEEIIRLIDKPASDSGYKPSTARRAQQKKQTQERDAIIRESYREWKERQPGEKSEWYAIQIANELEEMGYKIGPATVLRNMKK